MKRPAQHDGETALDYLSRVVGWLEYEHAHLTEDLPSVEAVLEFFELWNAYGTDLWSGIIDCIAEGDDPEPARKFVRKWKLGKEWMQAVNEAAKLAKTPT